MSRGLLWKIVLIAVLMVVGFWTLYPPHKTLKPGIDLAGGTSLIYEIDTQDLKEVEKRGLAERMITVLRERIDPAAIQNLIWRPQGSTRFEIQMPLASIEAQQKRSDYEQALDGLLAGNVNRAVVMRTLKLAAEERAKKFREYAQNDPNRQVVLDALSKAYDERKELQSQRDALSADLQTTEQKMPAAGVNTDLVKTNRGDWAKLADDKLTDALKKFTDVNDNVQLLAAHVKAFAQWSQVVNQIAEPNEGKNALYDKARRDLDKLNLTGDQLNLCLEMPVKSIKRKQAIEQLKTKFPNRADKIDKVVAAFDAYRPFRGRLDDPKDLQRMLKGAGILEFRILPTLGGTELDADQINAYIEALREKGPKYASDNQYVWCQIEKPDEWRAQDAQRNPTVAARFGEKAYVLASNKTDEAMTHNLGERQWRLQSAKPTTDDMGRRAIGFVLDERGRRPFANVTGKNIGRPLCILLDVVAISAPSIEARIPGEGIITGSFSETAVADMVNKLNAGSLPARLVEQPVSVNTIGPSIGEDNRNKGVLAGFIGLIVVVVFMTGYYTLAGGIAAFAMMLNLLFTLAIMAAIRATFTLPGIAGAILTIGMSVDANVLIYERIREEQKKGSSLRITIANGYQRAFSAIFDSNLTTILTAAVLYWVGSEEIKGFAIVLILGIASSMFTALIVTRVIFDILLAKRIIKNRLVMVNLVPKPHIDWMRLRPVFLAFSGLLTVVGIYVFFTRDDTKNSKYDIEFTGGTSVQISLKEGVNIARQQVEQRIRDVGIKIGNRALSAANVYSVGNSGKQYEINTTETNKTSAVVTFPQAGQITVDEISAKIRKTESEPRFGEGLSNLLVSQEPNNPVGYRLTTSQLNVSLVKEILATALPEAKITEPQVDQVVNNAVLTAFADDLEMQQNLQPTMTKQDRITEQMIEQYPELVDFLGGVCIRCDLERPTNLNDIEQRLDALKFRPDTRNLNWSYTYRLLGSDVNPIADPNQSFKSFTYVCVDPEAGFREFSEDEWAKFVGNEKAKVVTAAQIETSLPRVRQFDPSVGAEAKTRALIAIVLSLFAMIVYLWVRFGDVRYGVGALVALTHDTIITVGVVVACTYIAGTPIGNLLLIGDFKIDLAMIAAFLTLIGYSVNDTIVVFDRIRENVGKTRRLTPDLITNSINETMPRTMMTGLTTFFVIIIMYIFGGSGLRGFNFAMAFGLIIGTYSSIAIASPILLLRTKTQPEKGK